MGASIFLYSKSNYKMKHVARNGGDDYILSKSKMKHITRNGADDYILSKSKMKHVARGVFVSLLLSGLFFSCDKDSPGPEMPVEGEEVFLQIRTLEVAEGGESELARAAALRESETEYVPNGDGLFVKLGMEEDAESPLRAEKTLTTNAWFRVIAVRKESGIYISHGDFQQGGATTVADFHVTTNADYDIYCFSYNNTTNTLPSFNPARYTDISSTNLSGDLENLLWNKQTIHVDDAAPSLSFVLSYKAARVRVVVDCTYNDWTITGIGNTMQLGSVSVAQSVGLLSGTPSGDSAGNKAITWPALSEGTEQISEPLIVMPNGNSTTLTVTIPVNVVTRKSPLYPIPTEAGYTGKFTTQLEAGHSYKLFVKLKAPQFAGSNVYWTGTILTFDEHGDNSHQGYQGVFFKFGSLIGISPAGNFVANSTPIYSVYATGTRSSWDAIKYWDLSTYGSVITNAHESGYELGDICHRIRSTYRLPKPGEFGSGNSTSFNASTPVAGGWVKGSGNFQSNPGAGNTYGTANFLTNLNNANKPLGSAYNRTMDITLPAAGSSSGGTLYEIGSVGDYWMNSTGDIYASRMVFNGNDMYPSGGSIPNNALPVRCVKN
jgi:hypothetical protein